ncbi:MAG: hypothetical protein V2B18_20585 [Pseudomonadota bacterium]
MKYGLIACLSLSCLFLAFLGGCAGTAVQKKSEANDSRIREQDITQEKSESPPPGTEMGQPPILTKPTIQDGDAPAAAPSDYGTREPRHIGWSDKKGKGPDWNPSPDRNPKGRSGAEAPTDGYRR